jgi:hypothetical protein
MRALPALPGRAVIAALSRAGFEVIRNQGGVICCGIAMILAGKQSCRYIGMIYQPAHFA